MNDKFERIKAIIQGMLEKIRLIVERLLSPRWRPLSLGVAALAVIGLIILLWPPQRSTAAYCKIWDKQAKELQSLNSISHADEYAVFYGRLEQVAPADIRPDVRVQKLAYQKVAKDPTQALAVGLSTASADSNVHKWSESHCASGKTLNQ